MNKAVIVILLLAFAVTLFAQEKPADKDLEKELVEVHYEKKSASTAMLLSAIFPGAGQFYANPRSFTTYVFPVIEIALWYMYIDADSKGSDKEDKYMKYADQHYNRSDYQTCADNLSNIYPEANGIDDIYNDTHFRLDETNTQHFYEDIGKYNKYIFGWDDWHNKYAYNGNVEWAWDTTPTDPNHHWIGNYPTHPDYADQSDYDEIGDAMSPNRKKYIDMRADAEEDYDKADLYAILLVGNHIISALDAVRVTRDYNADYISKNWDINVKPAICCARLTPMLTFTQRF